MSNPICLCLLPCALRLWVCIWFPSTSMLQKNTGSLKQKKKRCCPHNPINHNVIQKNIWSLSHGLHYSSPFKCVTLPRMFFLFWLPSQLTCQPNYCLLKLICLILNWYAMFMNSFLLSRVRVLYLPYSLC